ncbi:MAG: DUF433 domain-containing protein [Ignavibacteria bacterium]|nr:DUF433 domain-containing protein [Ignavibacteria bacterium]
MKIKSININPEIMSGAPVFNGTRVTIQTLFDYLEDGYSVDGFLKVFDWVKKEDVIEILELAKNSFKSGKQVEDLYESIA